MQVGERKEGEEVNLGTWIQARWKRMPSSICAAEEPSEDGASVQSASWEPKIFSAARV